MATMLCQHHDRGIQPDFGVACCCWGQPPHACRCQRQCDPACAAAARVFSSSGAGGAWNLSDLMVCAGSAVTVAAVQLPLWHQHMTLLRTPRDMHGMWHVRPLPARYFLHGPRKTRQHVCSWIVRLAQHRHACVPLLAGSLILHPFRVLYMLCGCGRKLSAANISLGSRRLHSGAQHVACMAPW
jgi:hypothetical protein